MNNLNDTANSKTFQKIIKESKNIEERISNGEVKNCRMVTGDRPTGELHIGHYLGTLKKRVELQNNGVDAYILIADYQVITDRSNVQEVRKNVLGLIADYIASGINPKVSTIYCHSSLAPLNQLLLPFMSLVGVNELFRNPTVKSESVAVQMNNLSALMLTYPIHQTADILSLHGNVIPVGKDQLPHLQIAREIAKKFNKVYCEGDEYFIKPQALLSSTPMIYGVDGRKMSKSFNNSITLSMTEEETARMIKGAVTDGDRFITYDPINRPNVANLLNIAAGFSGRSPHDIAVEVGNGGAKELKRHVTEVVNESLKNHRKNRRELLMDEGYLLEVLNEGNSKALSIASETLDEVKDFMNMNY